MERRAAPRNPGKGSRITLRSIRATELPGSAVRLVHAMQALGEEMQIPVAKAERLELFYGREHVVAIRRS